MTRPVSSGFAVLRGTVSCCGEQRVGGHARPLASVYGGCQVDFPDAFFTTGPRAAVDERDVCRARLKGIESPLLVTRVVDRSGCGRGGWRVSSEWSICSRIDVSAMVGVFHANPVVGFEHSVTTIESPLLTLMALAIVVVCC